MPSLKYPNHLLFAESILARIIDRVQLFVHSYNKQPSKPSRSLLLYNYRVIWCHQIGVSMGLMWNGGQYVFWTKKDIVWLFTHLVLARIGPFSPAPLKWQQMILSLDKYRPPSSSSPFTSLQSERIFRISNNSADMSTMFVILVFLDSDHEHEN